MIQLAGFFRSTARLVLLTLLFTVLIACQSSKVDHSVTVQMAPLKPSLPKFDDTLFGEFVSVVEVEDVFQLSEEQELDFNEKFSSKDYKDLQPHQRVFKYLKKHLVNFNFHSDTLTATQAFEKNLGNCLSLAILTKSLSDLAEVEIDYQLVETPPVFQMEGGILLSSEHIRTVLYAPEMESLEGVFTIGRARISIDYFPSSGTRTLRRVEQNEFYAMYYRNKAAEAIVVKKLDSAYWNLKQALELNQNDAQAINMMAIIHNIVGQNSLAEKLFNYGLEHTDDHFELLTNYRLLLINERRLVEASDIEKKLEKYDSTNPFEWIDLADSAYKNKEYTRAIFYYKKAVKMADYLHEPYAGIARSEYQLGNKRSAKKSIEFALERSHTNSFKKLYQAKYDLFVGSD